MVIKNNQGKYVRVTFVRLGGMRVETVDKNQATEFTTNKIFDVLERLNESFPNEGWIAE